MNAKQDYKTSEDKFLKAVDKTLTNVKDKISALTTKQSTFDGNTLTLENNTVHVYTGPGVKNLTILKYPEGDFISTVLFSTYREGSVNVTFPTGTKFVGSAPYKFYPGENWELNIHNGRVVGSQLFE